MPTGSTMCVEHNDFRHLHRYAERRRDAAHGYLHGRGQQCFLRRRRADIRCGRNREHRHHDARVSEWRRLHGDERWKVRACQRDLPTRSCSFDRTFTGATACTGAIAQVQTGTTFIQRYTCKNGQWTGSNGIGVEGQLVSATSCTVSDGTVIANGQIIVQGFGAIAFDQYNTYGKRFMTTKCQNGTLFSCDASGANCTQAQASDPNANLASALMAIESALKAIIAKLGQ